jgi:beta-lactamase class A
VSSLPGWAIAANAGPPPGRFVDDNGHEAERYIERLASGGAISGCGPALVCPDQLLTRAEAAVMVWRLASSRGVLTAASTGNTFVDDDGLWNGEAEAAIESLAAAGIVRGCDATLNWFCPFTNITRGEAMSILVRALDLAAPAGFPDTLRDTAGKFYQEAARVAGYLDLVDMSTDDFRGESPITRAEFAMALLRAFGDDPCRADPFTDARAAALAAQFPYQRFSAFAWDEETGCVYALHLDARLPTASVFKVMVMAGTLLEALNQGRVISDQELAWLQPMISISANGPVRSLWGHFGGAPWFSEQASNFGLTETTIVGDYELVWGRTQTSARDQVNLLRQLLFGEWGPLDQAAHEQAWTLMTDIDPSQHWGVGTFAPTGATIAQKNGFAGVTANSVGGVRLADGRGYVLAVLSTGWSDWHNGIPAVDTIADWVHQSLGADMTTPLRVAPLPSLASLGESARTSFTSPSPFGPSPHSQARVEETHLRWGDKSYASLWPALRRRGKRRRRRDKPPAAIKVWIRSLSAAVSLAPKRFVTSNLPSAATPSVVIRAARTSTPATARAAKAWSKPVRSGGFWEGGRGPRRSGTPRLRT